MRFASRIFTALLGLALIWFFWPFGGDEVVTAVEPPPSAHDRLFTTSLPPAPKTAAAPVPKPEAPAPKTAAADGEPTAALTKQDEVAIKPPLKPKPYYRVVVRDGGRIEANGTVITLAGISARAADAKCKDAEGRAWACGARARAALVRLIRGRAVTCKVPASGEQKAVTASCTVGGTDLSTWMVAQGWAAAKEPNEPKLAKAADAARKKRLGIWR